MSSLSNSGSPTQFRGRSLQVEIFNNPVGGVFTEVIKLDDTWKTVKNDPRTKKNPLNNLEIHKFISIPLEHYRSSFYIANSDEYYTLSLIYSVVPLIDLCSNLLIKSLDAKEPLISKIQSISKADESKDKFLATMAHELR